MLALDRIGSHLLLALSLGALLLALGLLLLALSLLLTLSLLLALLRRLALDALLALWRCLLDPLLALRALGPGLLLTLLRRFALDALLLRCGLLGALLALRRLALGFRLFALGLGIGSLCCPVVLVAAALGLGRRSNRKRGDRCDEKHPRHGSNPCNVAVIISDHGAIRLITT
ncbi:MAG: hypothetical protein ABI626_03145 [Sphingomicrobium sp.]